MPFCLGYAESADPSDTNLLVVVLCGGFLVAVCAMAFLPLRMARIRRHRHAEAIVAVAVLWAILTAGSLAYASILQLKWSRDRTLNMQSGYYDPRSDTAPPPRPWGTWGVLAAIYGGLIVWAGSQRKTEFTAETPRTQRRE